MTSHARLGEACFSKVDKISGELFTLTYGALVAQLVKDYESHEEVNKQLDHMGYNIGVRLIDEFLAKSNVPRCRDFRETAETIAKVGFKMFLGISPDVGAFNQDGTACNIIFKDNPLEDFVELPATCKELKYSNILCGIIRGALEAVSMRVDAQIVGDVLQGDERTEIKVELKQMIEDEAGEDYHED